MRRGYKNERAEKPKAEVLILNMDNALAKVEEAALATLLLALIVCVALQVVSRYLLNVSFGWTEEAARFLFVWVAMVGSALAVQRKAHFALELVVARLGFAWHRRLNSAVRLIACAMSALIAAQGWRVLQLAGSEVGPGTGVPMVLVIAALPVGGILMMFHFIASLDRPVYDPATED
jgi:TRAP-type C4-dicarboxylate transport system permease small subunit